MDLYTQIEKIAQEINEKDNVDIGKCLQVMADIFKKQKEQDRGYFINEKGELYFACDHQKIFISNTIVIPISEVTVCSLEQSERFLQVIGIREGKRYLKPILIQQTDMRNEDWIRKEWGFKTVVSSMEGQAYRHIKNTMDFLMPYITNIKKYMYVGWDLNGRGIYLSYQNSIGRFNPRQLLMDDSLDGMEIAYMDCTEKEAFDFVINTMLKVTVPEVAYTAMSFSLLSLFTSIFSRRQRRPEFLFYLYGPSGSRKTTLAKLFFNINERYKNQMAINFVATKPAMEAMMSKMKDSVLVYDDIAPSVNKMEHQSNCVKLENLVRAYGDSVGRSKMGSEKKIVALYPLGLAAVTAENNMLISESSSARCYLTQLQPKDVDLVTLTKVQKQRDKFTTAVRNYISYAANDLQGFIKIFEQRFDANERMFSERNLQVHPRSIANVAWLKTSFDHFLEYGVYKGFISNEQVQILERKNDQILEANILVQRALLREDKPSQMFIRALSELLGSKRVFIAEIVKDGKKKIVENKVDGKLIGYKDAEYIYLLKNIAYISVKSFYAQQGRMFPATEKSFVEDLYVSGIIKPDGNQDGSKGVRININGIRTNVIRLWKEKLFNNNQNQVVAEMDFLNKGVC